MDDLILRAVRAGARRAPAARTSPPPGLPEDLRAFLERCGGLRFPSGLVVGDPARLVPTAPIALGPDEQVPHGDPAATTNVIAETGPEGTAERLVIDLSQKRMGRVYDGFWDVFGVAGSMVVVARSFTELLERLIADSSFWEAPEFEPLGDAYD